MAAKIEVISKSVQLIYDARSDITNVVIAVIEGEKKRKIQIGSIKCLDRLLYGRNESSYCGSEDQTICIASNELLRFYDTILNRKYEYKPSHKCKISYALSLQDKDKINKEIERLSAHWQKALLFAMNMPFRSNVNYANVRPHELVKQLNALDKKQVILSEDD